MSDEDRKLVADYQKKFDDARVDTNLIMELLVLLSNEDEEGNRNNVNLCLVHLEHTVQ